MKQTYREALSALRLAQNHRDHVRLAAIEYLGRQSRKKRPQGCLDSAGRWYPHLFERCGCCNTVLAPSRKYPHSLLIHCKTSHHVARLYNVSEGELLAMAQTL